MDETLTKIYVLVELDTKRKMYVGKTTISLRKRLSQHRRGMNPSTRHWFEECLKRGTDVDIVELDSCKAYQSEAFESYWIARTLKENPSLLNRDKPDNVETLFAIQLVNYYRTGKTGIDIYLQDHQVHQFINGFPVIDYETRQPFHYRNSPLPLGR